MPEISAYHDRIRYFEKIAAFAAQSFRYMFKVRTVRLGGVTIDTTVGHIPENVRELIFREIYEDTERDLIGKILKPGMRTLNRHRYWLRQSGCCPDLWREQRVLLRGQSGA